ncbi:FAD-dependent oxidoreductase [Actinomadura sp. ATCC 39365]
MRIVVVGAGLGGVAAAVGLHRRGHEVTLVERGAELREAGTGIVVMPNGLRALDALGLGEEVRAHVVHEGRGGLRDRRGRPLLITDMDRVREQIGIPVIIDRARLHRALRAPLPAELVRTSTPVERLEPDSTGVTVIAGGEPVARADAVIAADGIGSRLRAQLFPGHPGVRRTGRLDLRGMLPRPPDCRRTCSPASWSTAATGRCSACIPSARTCCTGSPTPPCTASRRTRRRRAGRCHP